MPVNDRIIRNAFGIPRTVQIEVNTNFTAVDSKATLMVEEHAVPPPLRKVFGRDRDVRYITYSIHDAKTPYINNIYDVLSDFGVLAKSTVVVHRGIDFHKIYRYLAYSPDDIDIEYIKDIDEDVYSGDVYYLGYQCCLYNLEDTSMLLRIKGCRVVDFFNIPSPTDDN